jgi:hypothetical protein
VGELEAIEHEFTQFCELLAEQVELRFAESTTLPIAEANGNGNPLWAAPTIAAVCLDEVPAGPAREAERLRLQSAGRELLEVSRPQLEQFAGQMLVLRSRSGEQCLHCSYRGWGALNKSQQALLLAHFTSITTHPLHAIERLSGGSVRALAVEVHSLHA